MVMSANYPIETIRHSTAHLLAAAITELYPGTKLGVGPVIPNGFFYDLDLPQPISVNDLPKIEKRMRKIIERGEEFRREEMQPDAAIAFFGGLGQTYKVELLEALKTKGTTAVRPEEAQDVDPSRPAITTVYHTGAFVDLCRGPHVGTTRDLGVFKLTKLAGAYWRGNEKNKQMTRIYGLAFQTPEELDAHLRMIEEAEKRDHRKIAHDLDLITFSPLVGSGLPLFTPRGTLLRQLLEDFVLSLQTKYGFLRVWIPHITKADLYKTSGHWDKFEDDLFHVKSKKSEDAFVLKPMNCPHHTQIYASRPRSYRDLPIRYAEVTTVYRDEHTGELQGLSRVRSITQDDAHVFCTPEQAKTEIANIYTVVTTFYKILKMSLRIRLSLHNPAKPEKYLGGREVWARSEGALKEFLESKKLTYETALGEAAFYGPKLDFMIKDAIGREWQLATIQLDANMPERFGLSYTDSDGAEKRPIMIHRAILGSVERFLGILIEHYAGAFPTWLAPVQVAIIPVGSSHERAVAKLTKMLSEAGIRAHANLSRDTVGYKIRAAEREKVPYMLVVGDKEKSLRKLSVRIRGVQKLKAMTPKSFIARLQKEIARRS